MVTKCARKSTSSTRKSETKRQSRRSSLHKRRTCCGLASTLLPVSGKHSLDKTLLVYVTFCDCGCVERARGRGWSTPHREHVAGYGFLFATPWAWLLDHPRWLGNVHNRSLMALIGYVLFLWIPASLYSGCLWLLFFGLGFRRSTGGTAEN